MKCTITVKMDNAAFCDDDNEDVRLGGELARIITAAATLVDGETFEESEEIVFRNALLDSNGNVVGEIVIDNE